MMGGWLEGVEAVLLDRSMAEVATVGNVLVGNPSVEESEQAARRYGAECGLTLHFPKSFEGSLLGLSVCLPAPWGGVYDVLGDPLPYDPRLTPGEHNRPVLVTRATVDPNARVRVLSTATRYVRGEAMTEEVAVYEGPAQARRSPDSAGGGKAALPDGGREAVETWFFVIPWQAGFDGLRPQSMRLERMDWEPAVPFDVESVEDAGGQPRRMSARAVRRG